MSAGSAVAPAADRPRRARRAYIAFLLAAITAIMVGAEFAQHALSRYAIFQSSMIAVLLIQRATNVTVATAVAFSATASFAAFTDADRVILLWTLLPAAAHGLMRGGVSSTVAPALVFILFELCDILILGGMLRAETGWATAAIQLIFGAVGGWAVGAIASGIEAALPSLRRAAATRYGRKLPTTRIGDVCAALLAIPLVVFVAVRAGGLERAWVERGQNEIAAAVQRIDARLSDWWAMEVVRHTFNAQAVLDRHYGYLGLAGSPFGGVELSSSWFGDGLVEGAIATREGHVIARSTSGVLITTQHMGRQIEIVGRLTGAALVPVTTPGADTALDLLIPIIRDGERLGHLWARYAANEITAGGSAPGDMTWRLLPTGPAADAPSDGAGRFDLTFLMGTRTAPRVALGRVVSEGRVTFTEDWRRVAAASLGHAVETGARQNLWRFSIVAAIACLFEVAGRRVIVTLVAQLLPLPGASRPRSTNESLVDDANETLRLHRSDVALQKPDGDQRRAEQAALIASAPVGLFALRATTGGRLAPSYMNAGMMALLDRAENAIHSPQDWAEVVQDDAVLTSIDAARRAHEATPTIRRERTVRRPNGETRRVYEELTMLVDDSGRLDFVGVWLDIEDRRRAEERVLHSSRLISLGEMATGMAHELNQPLNAIQLAAENLAIRLRRTELPEDVRSFVEARVERLSGQAQRAAAIIDRMRIFGRVGDSEDVFVAVNESANIAMETVQPQFLRDGIALQVVADPADPQVIARRGAIEQILVNFLSNARDATLQHRTGSSVPPADSHVVLQVTSTPTDVVMSVTDRGGGVPPAIMERMFEPFFTTKPVGKGTGLGLSISFGLATSMGGEITVENASGGAVFALKLPRASDDQPLQDQAG